MDAPIRVLVVDDSAAVRRLLTDILSQDPELTVVGAAANATLALTKVRQGGIDVITLDVEMPDVTGLELLEQIREIAPKLPVIMFSSLTQRAASTTLDALARGASDYVTKPSGVGSRETAAEQVRVQLIAKIKALGRRPGSLSKAQPRLAPGRSMPPAAGPVDIIAIGASTGGPNALSTVFERLHSGLLAPIVMVQHMPPLFTQLLADRLSTLGPIKVREAKEGDVVERGLALLAPGDFHMRVVRDGQQLRVTLDQGPHENSCRPAVDVLFRSVAQFCGGRSLGVMLTGMGQDGLIGSRLLKQAGGRIIAQDEATSVVWGMPGFVVRGGLADVVLPIENIGQEISRRATDLPRTIDSSSEVVHAGH